MRAPGTAVRTKRNSALLPGGTEALAEHAAKWMADGKSLGVALEIAEFAAAAAAAGEEGEEGQNGGRGRREHEVRAQILRALEKRETSLMASSIFRAAARDSEAKL